jgi:hypothetical protein
VAGFVGSTIVAIGDDISVEMNNILFATQATIT